MTQYAFYFDQSRCYGCQACSVACKDWNELQPGPEKWLTVYEWEKGSFPDLRIHILAFGCGHCENPVCLKACPNNALFKEEKYGAVLVDESKCKGARQCAVVCPYGAPKFASDAPGTKMTKCTMCIDRLEDGKLPICVSACPLRAFDFGPLEKIEAKYGNLRQLEDMPNPKGTKPCFIVQEHSSKKELIPYNKTQALELMRSRGDLGTLFESIEDVTKVEGAVRNTRLKMKHASGRDLLDATRSDNG
ncbi:4Fe-4S dicluster domain-containing protein [Desulfitobacterium hafniense]|uniref:Putative oxidoreductase iron-sulfur subunit n=1 Tax=Desulfitobacterium hafniense (strain Y51) TaxID=138119 RepID=Q24N21_DESHY|nr:4Fe-4S dicluster domain-containing protein [Desulfitobacterium hafniense]BAE86571.1 putative oxidoreductase iron-sulfur subunit [Desulfitobacterium hafniense Y51]